MKFEAIGTIWQIVLPDLPTQQHAAVTKAIMQRITDFDKNYSRFRSDSLVSQWAQQAGTYDLPLDAYTLLSFYEKLYRATNGLVTPLIGQTMVDAGYDEQYSFQPKQPTQPVTWDVVISYTPKQLTLQQPALLDFGAAGKGYLVDILGRLLLDHDVYEYTINAGGDILQASARGDALTIGLENPFNTEQVIGTTEINNQSICGSAGNRRAWGTYTHIIHPVDLTSPTDIAATWVTAADTMTADGIATALFFCDPKKVRQHFQFSYGVLASDMQLTTSTDFVVQTF